eukprot:TRINITY_DN11739_c0_g1_i1.p1 TRINITY_DN11739_c0_g1~~TRINITY_DN11739_c0_g1_i1.p1  ORF type:complete len:355 (+),score=86.00 TRINITY_DN11739_c0_g1_i1:43-1065(+)
MEASSSEVSFYELLGVEKDATAAAIKKGYYVKARRCHPDKNPDDPAAEEEFKMISEAYTVLSDPDSRELYDKYGKAGLSASESGVDPSALFAMMFGGEAFVDNFGELSLASSMSMSSQAQDYDQMQAQQELEQAKQAEKDEMLFHKLVIKLEPYVSGSLEGFDVVVKFDLERKLEAPGGAALVKLIGHVYIETAKQHMNRFFGIESFFSNVQEKVELVGSVYSVISTSVRMQRVQKEMEEGKHSTEDAQAKMLNHGLSAMWIVGKMEIEQTVRRVCKAVLTDPTISPALRQKRALGLEILGRKYQRAGRQVNPRENTSNPAHLNPDNLAANFAKTQTENQ